LRFSAVYRVGGLKSLQLFTLETGGGSRAKNRSFKLSTCSVFIQEESEDVTYWNTQFILQDMLNVFEKIIPTCQHQGQYLHPGPIHIKHAMEWRNEKPEWGLNTDAHLRSVFLGRSETIPIVDGEMTLGEFGRIYFADFDQTRERERNVRVQIVGE